MALSMVEWRALAASTSDLLALAQDKEAWFAELAARCYVPPEQRAALDALPGWADAPVQMEETPAEAEEAPAAVRA